MALLGSVDRRNTAEHLIVHRVWDPNINHTPPEHLYLTSWQSMEYRLPHKFPVLKIVHSFHTLKAKIKLAIDFNFENIL